MSCATLHKNGYGITTELLSTQNTLKNAHLFHICPGKIWIQNFIKDFNWWICFLCASGVPRRVALIIVFIVAFLTYFVSLEGTFVFDDSEAIVNNEDVKPETPISNLFHNDFWGTSLLHKNSHKSYRPLTILSFRHSKSIPNPNLLILNYKLSYRLNYLLDGGSLNAKFYHLTNLLLHSICSLLSLIIFSIIFNENHQPRLSFISSIIFSIHPVHTEAVILTLKPLKKSQNNHFSL